MNQIKYTDHNGSTFFADDIKQCPFCGSDGEIYFIGNTASKSRKAVAKCTNKMCRCEIVNATLRNDTEWVAKVTLEAWNKRVV